jgi:fucose permease
MERVLQTDINLSSTRVWTYSAWAGLGLYAWGVVIAGALLPEIVSVFGLRPSTTGMIIALPAVGFTAAGLIGGYLSSRVGLRWLLVVSAIGLAFGLGIAALAHSVAIFGAALLSIGLAGGTYEVGSNGLIAGLYPEAVARELNRLHIAFGIGAFVSPLIVAAILTGGVSWRANYAIPALMVLILLTILVFQLKTAKFNVITTSIPKLLSLIRRPTMIFAWVGAFLFAASELGISNWVAMYLRVEAGFTPQMASYALSLFWLSILAGRYLNTLLPTELAENKVIALQAACGATSLAVIFTTERVFIIFIGVALAGLFMAGILPWVLAYANRHNPGYAGLIAGFIQIGIGTGMLLGPGIIGLIYDASTLVAAMYVTILLLFLLAIVFIKSI